LIPEDPAPVFTADLTLQNILGTIALGSQNGTTLVTVESANFGAFDYGTINNAFQMGIIIPEPSAALLVALGALPLLRRKRN